MKIIYLRLLKTGLVYIDTEIYLKIFFSIYHMKKNKKQITLKSYVKNLY